MSDVDRMIKEVLEEDRPQPPGDLPEPGFFAFTFGALLGPGGWVNWILLVAQAAMFLGGAYAGWRCFAAPDVLEAVKWGFAGSTLLILALVTKMGIVPSIESNRVIREIRRLELRVEATAAERRRS